VRVATTLFAVGLVLAACDRGPVDAVVDTTIDAAVWREDGRRIAATLPRAVGTFQASEGADAFATSYATGPVFGGSCTYAEHDRQLTLRIEAGNIRSQLARDEQSRPRTGEAAPSFTTIEVTVHGAPGVLRSSALGQISETRLVLDRRYIVTLRVAPSKNYDESLELAETLDLGRLSSLVLDGVSR
jgi:hypothetical protein